MKLYIERIKKPFTLNGKPCELVYLEEQRMLNEALIQQQQRDMESIIMSNIKM